MKSSFSRGVCSQVDSWQSVFLSNQATGSPSSRCEEVFFHFFANVQRISRSPVRVIEQGVCGVTL